MTRRQLGDMDPDAFRRHGHRLIEWVGDYLSHSERYPPLSQVHPGEVREALPKAAPAEGERFDEILDDFERVILPGVTHWNHPGFFAYFAITGSAPGVLAELLTAALNVQAMLWQTSPAATELEEVVLGWLRQLLGLPPSFEGVIYDTASIATLHALAAARDAAVPDVRARGLAGRPDVPLLRVYCSEQAHSSIDKATILLGMGHAALRKTPVDEAVSSATGGAAVGYRRGPVGRMVARRRRGHGRHDVNHERRSGPRRSRYLRGGTDLAARGRGVRWCRGHGARHGAHPQWMRPGRLPRREPTQMVVHPVRPQRLLLSSNGRRPRHLRPYARVPRDG